MDLDESLAECSDHLLDALFSIENSGNGEDEELVAIHWAIKDVLSDIQKYRGNQ